MKIVIIVLGFDMLTCYGCELTVHRYCYGLKTPINQVKESSGQIVNMFICDRCSSVGPNELKVLRFSIENKFLS